MRWKSKLEIFKECVTWLNLILSHIRSLLLYMLAANPYDAWETGNIINDHFVV